MVDEDGSVTDDTVDCYSSLAHGEIGLIITGHAYVHPLGQGSARQMAIHDDRFVPGLERIAMGVHALDGRIAVQLSHAGRQTRREIVSSTPVAPSGLPYGLQKTIPHELSDAEIEELVELFASAAGRVKAAGFDAIQLHGAHGYLVSQFLSTASNARTDKWGGDRAKRFRFLAELFTRVKEEVGRDFPVFVKLGMEDFIEGGLKLSESISIAGRLRELGIDAIETSGGFSSTMENIKKGILPGKGEAYFRHYASSLKEKVEVPVILVGGLRSLREMANVVESGDADFVSLSRPFIREPDLVSKLKAGAPAVSCSSCNRCSLARGTELKCLEIEKEMSKRPH
jgi:2,4-dienoyl-CoA reductase-like NADH-dependent reductase (Old Yellow Enzyme family)